MLKVHFAPSLQSMSKSNLNLYCQKSHIPTPRYVTSQKGDLFYSAVTVNGESYGSVEGHTTKKEAEQDAAGVALLSLVQRHPTANSAEDLIKTVDTEMSSKQNKYLAGQNLPPNSAKKPWAAKQSPQQPFSTTASSARPVTKQNRAIACRNLSPNTTQRPMTTTTTITVTTKALASQNFSPHLTPSPQAVPQQGLRESLTTVSAHMLLSQHQERQVSESPPSLRPPGVGVATTPGLAQIGGEYENLPCPTPSLHSTPFPHDVLGSSANHRWPPLPRGLLAQMQYPAALTVPPGFALRPSPPLPPHSHPSFPIPPSGPYLPMHPILSGGVAVYGAPPLGSVLVKEPQQMAAEMPRSSLSPPWGETGAEGYQAGESPRDVFLTLE